MKITKIRIKNLFGITEYDSDGKSKELIGTNGVGKSRILDAIKYGLTNRSDREYIITKGKDEGEIIIETDTGLRIHRKKRLQQADYKSIKGGDGTPVNESFIREIFTELQLDPVKFIGMDKNEQNRIILDMIDFKWSLDWIKEQFGEIVPDVDYEQNILSVLYQIQADEGFYFQKRQSLNRDARNKKAFIDEIGESLPTNYNGKEWEKEELGPIYKEIETIRNRNEKIERAKQVVENRDNKVRSFKADLEIEVNSIEKATGFDRGNLEKEIVQLENRIKECKTELSSIEEKKIGKINLAKKSHEAKVAEYEGQVKEYEGLAKEEIKPFSNLQTKAENIEKMKSFVNEYKRMLTLQDEVEKLNLDSEEFTRQIEKARILPGEILQNSNIPIKGISVENGIALINGLPISNLSEGEKLDLCIDVSSQKPGSLQLVLIDGVEKLANPLRDTVYSKLKAKGVQYIVTRTTDEPELTAIEL